MGARHKRNWRRFLRLKEIIKISTFGSYHCVNVIELQFFDYEPVNVQSLCHELNHALHYQLGIEGHYSLAGDLESALEQDLFRLDDKLPEHTDYYIQIPRMLACHLFSTGHRSDMTDMLKFSQQKLHRLLQISLPWDHLEETWNIIGFANIDDCIYVNTLSDLNYMKVPALFHLGFLQSDWRNWETYLPEYDLSLYPSLKLFLEKLEETITKNIAALCPTPEAWEVWLKLQGREDANVGYFTTVDKTQEELMALIQKVELIEDR